MMNALFCRMDDDLKGAFADVLDMLLSCNEPEA